MCVIVLKRMGFIDPVTYSIHKTDDKVVHDCGLIHSIKKTQTHVCIHVTSHIMYVHTLQIILFYFRLIQCT